MSHLPASIEAYLEEAGFSGTEMLIVRQLLAQDEMTLREIAAKTAKSTGMLDQAMKKLLVRKIVVKKTINDAPKYALNDLEFIVERVEREMEQKQQELRRRHQNFESFIATIAVDKHRPGMEYFDGEDALRKAYVKLLDIAGKETLHYFPVTTTAEADPLRAFRVEYFRERRRRGIFSRFVIHNTSLGRRFQTRDPFEYRQSILVEESQYPFTFEQVIAGDTIACFHHKEQRACFIRFPEYAATQRAMFEKLWQKKTARPPARSAAADVPSVSPAPGPADAAATLPPSAPATAAPPSIPLSTRSLSALRDFFLSRRSLATLAVFGVLAAGMTYSLYRSNVNLNTQRIRERALAIAATGALQFDPVDLNELRTPEDITKPEYAKVIYKLNEIRRQNEDVKYIYIMRPTDDPNTLEFVADADSLDPYAKKDLNGDGVVNEADTLTPPGYRYVLDDHGEVAEMFATKKPVADREPFTDQWGTFLSGQAPIKNGTGSVVAFLGVDIYADKVHELTESTFKPFLWFIGIFLFFVLIRLAAFNRVLMKELWELMQMKKVVVTFTLCGVVALGMTYGTYLYSVRINTERMREKVMSIAATGSLQFSWNDLQELQSLEDTKKPIYGKIIDQLNAIRQGNKDIVYVYIVKPTDDNNAFVFVADADAGDPTAEIDTNNDGLVNDADALGVPGLTYDVTGNDVLSTGRYYSPTANERPYTDQWGSFLTGYAPIKDATGQVRAVLAVDVWADHVYDVNSRTFAPLGIFFLFLFLFVLFRAPGFTKSLLHQILQLLKKKNVLIALGISALLSLIITYGMYQYTLSLMKDEIGQRLMSIAATAAPEIRGEDLEKIHTEEDMKTEEYQRVFRKLNEIRERNKKIKYIYTFRQSPDPEQWEFVVDSDSNYFIPHLEWDYNNDGKLDAADENVTPGTKYDIKKYAPEIFLEGYKKPVITKDMSTDQWGTFLTATAPIRKNDGTAVAVLGVDMEASDIYKFTGLMENFGG